MIDMRPATLLLACATALLARPASPVQAQARLSLDLTAGSGIGRGGVRPYSQGFFPLGAAVSGEVKRVGAGRLMSGLAFSRQYEGPHGDKGYVQPDGESIGGAWPFFRSLSALGALDFPGPVAGRITGGVGAFRDRFGYTTGGLSASADLTIPGRTRVGFLLSGSRTLLPSYRGGSYRMTSVVIGLRFSSR